MMTLFSAPTGLQSHRTRIVAAEKGIEIDVINVVPGKYPHDLLEVNPYNTLPTLLDRDLVLYDARIIIDYLDERFPHPPLMPVDPTTRAQFRIAMYRIEREWYEVGDAIEAATDPKLRAQLAAQLAGRIGESAELFKIKPFFLSDEFSVVDATIMPVLWRLRRYGIELPATAQPVVRYAAIMQARPTFRASLSPAEVAMSKG
jgi:RNA polymerase-associated protein